MDFRGEEELPESKMAGISENDFHNSGIGCAIRGKWTVEYFYGGELSCFDDFPSSFFAFFRFLCFCLRPRFFRFLKDRKMK
jgi:hypothetical protein